MTQLPSTWENDFGYFITYWGEIFSGIAFKKDISADEFYIIPMYKFKEFDEQLQKSVRSEINFDEYGIKIQSPNIIEKHIPKNTLKINSNYDNYINISPTNRYKRMYVFGAGATYSCVSGQGKSSIAGYKWKSPLGNELFAERFDEIIQKYPGLIEIIPKYELQENNIETIMELDWYKIIKSRNVKLTSQHIQIQYYLQELFSIISNELPKDYFRYNLYQSFVQLIFETEKKDNDIPVLVNFNYDTCLDKALEGQFQFKFSKLTDYMDQDGTNHFLYFKPHGSCNWCWEFKSDFNESGQVNISKWLYNKQISPAKIYYDYLSGPMITDLGLGIESGFHPHSIGKLTPNRDLIKVNSNYKNKFPAVLLPFKDKDDFVMPYSHQGYLQGIIGEISELVLIGWKGNEHLFNTLFKKHANNLKVITIVNPDSKGVKANLEEYLTNKAITFFEYADFETYVKTKVNNT